jgi:dTDP-4-amino-4,6-dideoxygalactose transaminase
MQSSEHKSYDPNDVIPFSPPLIGEAEIAEVVDTLRSDWITTGPKTKRFEQAFARRVGADDAVALSSCTAGLHTALLAHGIGPGDEVITTPMTFAATVNVIEHVGARPILVDVEPDTLCLDPQKVKNAITADTKAIIAVHYAGHPVDMDALEIIADHHALVIIEDAAHALPAAYRGRTVGSRKHLTAFSFYATKNMTTAEGGMLTGEPALLAKVRTLSLHGMSRHAWNRYGKEGTWHYDIEAPGFKYNMTDIQAALGLHQLQRLNDFVQRRLEIATEYLRELSSVDYLQLPNTRADIKHAWHLFILRIHDHQLRIDRNQFIQEMKARGVACSVHFIPIHLHSYYKNKYGYAADDFPIAYSNYQRMLSLPLNPSLTDQQVATVIEAVLDICQKYQRLVA